MSTEKPSSTTSPPWARKDSEMTGEDEDEMEMGDPEPSPGSRAAIKRRNNRGVQYVPSKPLKDYMEATGRHNIDIATAIGISGTWVNMMLVKGMMPKWMMGQIELFKRRDGNTTGNPERAAYIIYVPKERADDFDRMCRLIQIVPTKLNIA